MKPAVPPPPRAAVIYLGMQSPRVDEEIELPELIDTPPPAISDTPPAPVRDQDNKNLVRDDFNDRSGDA